MADYGEVVEKLRRSTVQIKAHRHASGSGVVWSRDGRIVTNAHVIDGANTHANSGPIEVELWDGRRLPGQIVKANQRRDLAVLQVEGSGLQAAICGDSHALRVGELVIAVGNPLGFTGAASTGVVHRVTSHMSQPWVVSQVRLAPGNSGGPLANARGEVVGINTMIAGGLAFAIPTHSVSQFLSAPVDAQVNPQTGLGVVVRPVSVETSPSQLGLIVLHVIPHSPADRASLLQGDILLGAAGRRFQAVHDLELAIHSNLGGTLPLQFRRGANANIRSVTAQLPLPSVRAA